MTKSLLPIIAALLALAAHAQAPKKLVKIVAVASDSGSVTVNRAGCPPTCSQAIPENTLIIVEAKPKPGFAFIKWEGQADCVRQNVVGCSFAARQDVRLVAHFGAVEKSTLSVRVVEGGSVRSEDGKIDCGTKCTLDSHKWARVTLRAVAKPGYTFAGYQNGPPCQTGSAGTLCKLIVPGGNAEIRAVFTKGK